MLKLYYVFCFLILSISYQVNAAGKFFNEMATNVKPSYALNNLANKSQYLNFRKKNYRENAIEFHNFDAEKKISKTYYNHDFSETDYQRYLGALKLWLHQKNFKNEINFKQNGINDECIIEIMDALKGNKTLQSLNLSDNKLNVLGLEYAIYCTMYLKNLKLLDLRGNLGCYAYDPEIQDYILNKKIKAVKKYNPDLIVQLWY